MSNQANPRVREIIREMCAGNSSLAAEVLADEFVVIPRSDLPDVKRSEHDENTYLTDGENVVYTGEDNAKMWCLRDIAVWQFIATEGATRNNRRDELARELAGDGGYAYRFAEEPLKTAIDRIIELENAK